MATFDDDEFEIIEHPVIAAPATASPPTSEPQKDASLPHTANSTSERAPSASVRDRDDFDVLVELMQQTVEGYAPLTKPLFHLDLSAPHTNDSLPIPIFQTFIDHLPQETRAEHNCPTCRRFLDQYGDLCMVNEDNGSLIPLLWPGGDHTRLPPMYQQAMIAIQKLFHFASVGKDYQVTDKGDLVLGQEPSNNCTWRHFHIRLSEASLPPPPPAEKLDTEQEYTMLVRILKDNDLKTINHTHHLLHEKLSYSTTHRPAITWLQQLASKLEGKRPNPHQNILCLYARTAWVGLIHSLRNGLIGSLLGWVKQGLSFTQLNDRWERLADPTYYMRAKAKPKLGNVQTAEEKMKELGYTKDDLLRYHTAIDELPEKAVLWKDEKLWTPTKVGKGVATDDGTIFGWLESSDKAPATSISFHTFAKRILPKAEHVDIWLKDKDCITFFTRGGEGRKSPFVFDSGDSANTMSWYQYGEGTPISQANLKARWNRVKGIVVYPHMWDYLTPLEAVEWEEGTVDTAKPWIHSRQGVRFLFCLEGAKEMDSSNGLCLFPSLFKSELHSIRQTVEAFGEQHKIQWPHRKGSGKAQVGGISVEKDGSIDIRLRVTTTQGIVTEYKIALFS